MNLGYELCDMKRSSIVICFSSTKSVTVKPVLGHDCHERPPVLKDHKFLIESPTFRCK